MEPWTAFKKIFDELKRHRGAPVEVLLAEWRDESDLTFKPPGSRSLANYCDEGYYRKNSERMKRPFVPFGNQPHLLLRLCAMCKRYKLADGLVDAIRSLSHEPIVVARAGPGHIADRGQRVEGPRQEDKDALDQYCLVKDKQLSLAKEMGNRGAMLECLASLAAVYAEQGNWEKVVETRARLVKEHQEGRDPLLEADALTQLGWDQYSASLLEQSQKSFRCAKAKWLALKCPDWSRYCDTLDGIAVTLRAIARNNTDDAGLNEAVQLLRESLALRFKLGSPSGIASTQHRLGHLLAQVAYITRERATTIPNESEWKMAQKSLSGVIKAAEKALLESQHIRLDQGAMLDYCLSANQHAGLLVTLLDRSREDEIRAIVKKVIDTSERFKLALPWFQAQIILLRLERKLGHYQQAMDGLKSAYARMAMFEESHYFVAKLREQHAKSALKMGKKKAAIDSWKAVKKIWRTLREHKRAEAAEQSLRTIELEG